MGFILLRGALEVFVWPSARHWAPLSCALYVTVLHISCKGKSLRELLLGSISALGFRV